MSNCLIGKRLLYLGGIKRSKVIVERAQKLGIHVVVADYLVDSPAKEIADESVLINATNSDEIVNYVYDHKIDGIFSAYADVILKPWYESCEKLGLPCYLNEKVIRFSTDKEYFKYCCENHRINVPKTFNESVYHNLSFPVFIKPCDASGSRGASVCRSREDFETLYNNALSFSKSKKVIIEQFLEGQEFILDYIVIDGIPYLQSMADRYTTSDRPAAINHPNLMIFPSKHLKIYEEKVHNDVKDMLGDIGIRNGIMFLQGYCDNNVISLYEAGARLGGTWPYIVEHFTGVNPMDLLLTFSITGNMSPGLTPNIDPHFSGYGSNIYFLAKKSGIKIVSIKGIDFIRDLKSTVCIIQYYEEGDVTDGSKSTDILLLAVHIVADSYKVLVDRINEVYNNIDFYDEKGESILMKHYDTKMLKGYDI